MCCQSPDDVYVCRSLSKQRQEEIFEFVVQQSVFCETGAIYGLCSTFAFFHFFQVLRDAAHYHV